MLAEQKCGGVMVPRSRRRNGPGTYMQGLFAAHLGLLPVLATAVRAARKIQCPCQAPGARSWPRKISARRTFCMFGAISNFFGTLFHRNPAPVEMQWHFLATGRSLHPVPPKAPGNKGVQSQCLLKTFGIRLRDTVSTFFHETFKHNCFQISRTH